MHYITEQHGEKDKCPQIVRTSQDFAVYMKMPFVLYSVLCMIYIKRTYLTFSLPFFFICGTCFVDPNKE